MTSKTKSNGTNPSGLNHNSFALNRATENDSPLFPSSVIVRDGHHKGTLFTWVNGKWILFDLENREHVGEFDRLAVVSIDPSGDPDEADYGLNQMGIGFDMEVTGGEWVVDAEALPGLRETYGKALIVKWEQDGGDGE